MCLILIRLSSGHRQTRSSGLSHGFRVFMRGFRVLIMMRIHAAWHCVLPSHAFRRNCGKPTNKACQCTALQPPRNCDSSSLRPSASRPHTMDSKNAAAGCASPPLPPKPTPHQSNPPPSQRPAGNVAHSTLSSRPATAAGELPHCAL